MERMASKCKHVRRRKERDYFPGALEFGLGDHVERVLDRIGLTKARWEEAVNFYRREKKGCGCGNRQDFLNWAGSHFGMSPGNSKELRSVTLDTQPMRGCAIHGACIFHDKFSEEVVEAIRRQGVQPCQHCKDFEETN
jgi:hypothetical protein